MKLRVSKVQARKLLKRKVNEGRNILLGLYNPLSVYNWFKGTKEILNRVFVSSRMSNELHGRMLSLALDWQQSNEGNDFKLLNKSVTQLENLWKNVGRADTNSKDSPGARKKNHSRSKKMDSNLDNSISSNGDATKINSSKKTRSNSPQNVSAQLAKHRSRVRSPVIAKKGVTATLEVGLRNAVPKSDCFIVHGHDEGAKEFCARFIEKLGLSAIILHEQPNAGRTIIEKFEHHANVGYAVVLMTPDDVVVSGSDPKNTKLRARQNVIFELGYFIGKLGRGKVCVLYKGRVEIPSDYQGVLYIPMDPAGSWKMALAKEIKNAGIEVDLNKI